jgi:hypothetical protein
MRSRLNSFSFVAIVSALVVGCDGGAAGLDASSTVDSGSDAQATDAALELDAPLFDALAPDAVVPDSGLPCPDDDGDSHASSACGGDDCDDADPHAFPDNPELCDPADHDEDCDPSTFGARDRDGDGFADAACCNVAPGGARSCGPDCDDGLTAYHPGANGTCGICPAPYRRLEVCDGLDDDCSGIIDDGTAPDGCAVANGTAICSAGACAFVSCDAGYHPCGSACSSNVSIASCGASCTRCEPPANATATCDGTSCGFVCVTGTVLVGGACDPRPPRPIAPLSTATVTSVRPTLHWSLVPGTDGARVDVCRDRACASIVTTFDASGSSGAPSVDLPAGVVFWRLYGRVGLNAGAATSVTWQFSVGAASAPVDTSAGTTLDANGDGYADVAVGAWGALGPSGTNTGAVRVYVGSAGGVLTPPAYRFYGPDGADGTFGISVASAGDVNGDGFADLVAGADGVSFNSGRAYVYLGSASGLGTTAATALIGPDGMNAHFGYAVSSAGDVNGDGYGDVAIGSYGATGRGRVYVYLGGASGLPTTSATTLVGPDGLNGNFGWSLSSAGDVNGDGFGDLVVGAPGASMSVGAFHVYLGSASGLGTTPTASFPGADASGRFGTSVSGARDVNGDGYSDVVAGAHAVDTNTGRARVFLGGPSGLGTSAATTFVGPDGPGGSFGTAVAVVPDVNGDGYAEVVIGATGVSSSAGRAYLYLGGPSVSAVPTTTFTGLDGAGAAFGNFVAGVGDVNGDHYGDIAIAASRAATRTGRVRIYLGGPVGPGTTAATTISGPDGADGYFGVSIATAAIRAVSESASVPAPVCATGSRG